MAELNQLEVSLGLSPSSSGDQPHMTLLRILQALARRTPPLEGNAPSVKDVLANVIRIQDERRRLNHRASSPIDFVDGINETARAFGLRDDDLADIWGFGRPLMTWPPSEGDPSDR